MKTWRGLSRREFVASVAGAAGAPWLATHALAAPGQDAVVNAAGAAGHSDTRERIGWRVKPFPMTQVRLGKGPFQIAMEAARRYLQMLPSDRLLHNFRRNVGRPSGAEPLGGWEKPDCELRGHFTGGHYLSASALMYASTGDEDVKKKADGIVAELAQCQKALQNGYLSAFPEDFFDRLRAGRPVWAPFYTLHKIMAGHLDMHVHCANTQALETVEGMARWVGRWTESLSDNHMQRVLNVEHGGMMEVLFNLYAVTGREWYAEIARRFDHKQVFDPLGAHRDELQGLHANTNIPKITGAARGYELTGDRRFRDLASYFWEEVTSERTYCTGGTSNGEHWNTPPGNLTTELGKETEECCCGYNMLKLTRHIFGWTADPRAMDYYERTLYNSRLGTQNPDDGAMSYFLPLGSGYWKSFNSPFNSFWCCTGTGVEEFAKLVDTIYFHDERGIFVNLFIPSEVHWPEKGIRLKQETDFPEAETTRLVVHAERPVDLALNIRIPYWATLGGEVKLNGEILPVFSSPSSYLVLHRLWKDGDRVEVRLPMSLHAEALPGDPTQQAMMYGPLVLAGRLGSENLDESMVYLGYGPVPAGDPVPVPAIAVNSKDLTAWLEPDSSRPLTFATTGQNEKIKLIPLFKIVGERYAVYWKTTARAA